MENVKVKVNPTFHAQLKGNSKWNGGTSERYLEYRRKWEENPPKFIVEDAPIHLDIETSSICNLKCPMCCVTIEAQKEDGGTIAKGIMSWETYTKIIDEAAEIGVYSVKLNWRGEPTINKLLPQMIKYAKDKGIIDVMINTNGVLMDEEYTKKIIDAGVDKVFFSFDSIKPDKYEKIRVGAKFDDVVRNIKYFAEYNEKKGHPVYTRVQKVLMNDTEDENQDFINFFSDIVDQVAFEDYYPYGDLEYGKKVESCEKIQFACSQLWQRMLITFDGECRVCCRSGVELFSVGNISNRTIKEVWNGKEMTEMRHKHQSGCWYDVELCKNCYIPYM